MSDNDNASNMGGVVDASILNPDASDAGGIPDFLRRDNAGGFGNPVAQQPETSGETASEGEHEEQPQGTDATIASAPSEQEKAAHSQAEDTPTGNLTHDVSTNRPMSEEEMKREFMRDINTFGRQSGTGASALPRLGLRVLRAAADGLISTEKPKGGGKSDAVLIYEAYAAQDSKHSEHTEGGKKANAAKLNAIIGMGVMTTIDPVAVGDRMCRLHEQMVEAELKPKPFFAGLVDVARAQQDSDTELTDDAIKAALTKTVKDKTLEKEWEAIQKKVDGLIAGENPAGLKDQSERALKIGELINEHVKNYKADGADDSMVQFLIENKGYTEAQAREIVAKRPA